MNKSVFFLSLFLPVISACGFHLKGTKIENHLSNLELQCTEENEQCRAFQELCKIQNISISDSAEYKVVLTDFTSQARETANGGDSGNSREVEISDGYKVRLIKQGSVIAERNIINQESLQYKSQNFLGNNRESEITHKNLARENANSALRFVNSVLK
ncbi:MAG: hypothetical protein IJ566_01030 [Cardiobacteriaceae bacterium]|nr:hypothetical protein [Cardiobacteriaceae bacterium]